jgi:hypothetical protein
VHTQLHRSQLHNIPSLTHGDSLDQWLDFMYSVLQKMWRIGPLLLSSFSQSVQTGLAMLGCVI